MTRRTTGIWFAGMMTACALCTVPARAEIYTFWKTDQCPNIGIPLVWSEVGTMQAPIFEYIPPLVLEFGQPGGGTDCTECAGIGVGAAAGLGVGGAHCTLDGLGLAAANSNNTKGRQVFNAEIRVDPSVDPVPPTCTGGPCVWKCVVCRYQATSAAIPAISALGTALMIGGLIVAGMYEIRRRQAMAS
jgi:hypothetical protein